MKTDNYVDVKALKKDTAKLIKKVNAAADEAVAHTVEQSVAFAMSFDSIESIPFVKNKSGKIVVTVTDASQVALEEAVMLESEKTLDALKQEFVQDVKGALK